MAKVSWRQLHDLKLGGIADYIDVWEKTNKGIKDTVAEAKEVVKPGVKKAFGDMAKDDMYSDGAEAAKKQLKSLTDQLEDAKIEGNAIEDVVRAAKDDLKRLRGDFRDKVDEINGTKPDVDGAGKFSVDIDNELVNIPTKPTGKQWNSSTSIEEWNNAYQPKAEAFAEELHDVIKEADEVDTEASNTLSGISGNRTEKFNGDADNLEEEYSKERQERDADEVEDRLSDGDVTKEDIEYANDMMKKHEGEEFFATKLMDDLGPEGLAKVYGEAALLSPAGDKEMDKFQKYLGSTLATATDSSNNGPHLGDDFMEEFQKAGAKEMSFDWDDDRYPSVDVLGYEVLAPLLEQGEFDPDFMVPVGEHMVQIELEQGRLVNQARGDEGLFNMRNPAHSPLDSLMVGMSNSPDASLEFFTKEPERELEGSARELPDSYLDLFATDTGQLSLQELDPKCIGGAFEAAATGMDADNPTDPARKHTEEMAAFTRDLITTVSENPELYSKDGELRGTVDSLSDIGTNYMADIYQTYQSDYDPDVHSWIPKSWAEGGGELGMFSGKEEGAVNGFLDVLGSDPDSALKMAVASEAVATSALENKFGPDDFDKYDDALTPHTKIIGEINADGMQQIYKDYAEQDKSTNNTIDIVSRSLNAVIGGGIVIENPLAGAIVKGTIGEGITALAGELKVDSTAEAEIKADLKAVESTDALYSWGYDVFYEQMEKEHPDWGKDELESEAAAAADELENKYSTQLGLRK